MQNTHLPLFMCVCVCHSCCCCCLIIPLFSDRWLEQPSMSDSFLRKQVVLAGTVGIRVLGSLDKIQHHGSSYVLSTQKQELIYNLTWLDHLIYELAVELFDKKSKKWNANTKCNCAARSSLSMVLPAVFIIINDDGKKPEARYYWGALLSFHLDR